jgi:Tfp pilus assembly protein PilF
MTSPATLTADISDAKPTAPSKSPAHRRLFRSSDDAALLVGFLLALGTVAAYTSSLRNGFVSLDDRLYVTQNPNVLRGLSWSNFLWALRTTSVDYWHPLTWLVHMADVQMFGLHAAGHHLVSLLLHVFNVVVLFQLLRKATGSLVRSAMAAALFAVFPLNVESVAWVAETKTLLCTAVLLLALWAYGWYVRRPGTARYILVFALFGLGLMAKPMLVTFPVALLLLDYWPLQRTGSRFAATGSHYAGHISWPWLILEKLPLLALSAASALSTIASQRVAGAVVSTAHYPLSWRVKTVVWSYADYILKGLWPAHLAAFYPYEGRTLPILQVLAAGAALLVVSALVWRFRAKKYLLVGWLWYLVALLPVIGIVQSGSQGMADRYAYIPFWGLFLATVWLIADSATSLRAARPALAAACACILAAYGGVTVAQVHVWHDSYALFSHAAKVVPRNAFAEENLGELLMDAGRPYDAFSHYEAAAQYMPTSSIVHYNLGAILQSQNRLEDAAREYNLAILYETTAPMLWNEYDNLGGTYARMNRLSNAVTAFSEAIKLDPNAAPAYKNRALVEYSQNDFPAARDDFARAARLAPDAQTYYWLGRMFETEGDNKAAAENYEAALRVAPSGFGDAQARLDAMKRK